MKKIRKILLLALSIGLLTSCSQSTHIHKWSSYFDNGDGTHTRTCLKDVHHVETEPHTFKEEEVLVEPTDVTPGSSKMVCSKCGYTEIVVVPPTGHHVFDKEVVDEKYLYEKCSDYCAIYYKSSEDGAYGDPNYLFESSLLPEGYSNIEFIQGSGTQYIDTGIKKTNSTSIKYNRCKEGTIGRLPYPYQEVEYIEFTGTQFINTEITDKATWKLNVSWTNKVDRQLMGYHGGNTEYFGVNQGKYAIYQLSDISIGEKDYVVFDFENEMTIGLYVNNVKALNNSLSDIQGRAFTIGALSNNFFCHMKLYSFDCYQDNVVKGQFIPSYDKTTNQIGLYDLVNNKFFTNSGTGTFLKGKDVIYQGRLPSDYQELEYIENSSGAYIETDVIPNQDTSFECEFEISSFGDGDSLVYGAANENYSDNSFEIYTWNDKLQINYSGQYIQLEHSGNHIKLISEKNNYYLSGGVTSETSFNYKDSEAKNPLTLFALNRNDGSHPSKNPVKIYSFKVFDGNGNLLNDFVPCYQIVTNEVGMYDIVNKVFYSNDGTGTFLKGKEVTLEKKLPSEYVELSYLESTGTQYLDLGIGMTSNSRVETTVMVNNAYNFNMLYGIWPYFSLAITNENKLCIGCKECIKQYDADFSLSEVHNIIQSPDKISIDNIDYDLGFDSFTVGQGNIMLFGASDGMDRSKPYNWGGDKGYSQCEIYSFKLYNNNVLVRNLVPCYCIETSEAGMYDLVSNQFFTNQGEGEFSFKNKLEDKKVPLNAQKTSQNIDVSDTYTELEYIESSGTQYIDTKETTKDNFGCVINYSYTNLDTDDVDIMGTDGKDDIPWSILINYFHDQTRTVVGKDTLQLFTDKPEVNTLYTSKILYNDNHFYHFINDELKQTCEVECVDGINSLYLFARNSFNTSTNFSSSKIYSCQFYNGDEIIKDFVPVIRNSDEKVGLLDKVNNEFYENKGTGDFIAGPMKVDLYTELEYIESTGTQFINTGVISKDNTKSILDVQIDKITNTVYDWSCLYGYSKDSSGRPYSIWGNSNKNEISLYNNDDNVTRIPFTSNRQILEINCVNPIEEGDIYVFSMGPNTGKYLNALNPYKLFGLEIYQDNELVRDYVPVVRNTDGEIGLLDKLTNEFYENNGEGEFVPGPVKPKKQDNILIGYRYSGYSPSYNYGRIYDAVIYEDDQVVRNFIPCIRNSDSKVGMYDLVTNKFYPTTSVNEFNHSKVIGHVLDDGIITKEATFDEDGIKEYTCSICGTKIHEIIPKLSYKVTFTYDEGIKEIRIYHNDKDENDFIVSDIAYSRNLFSYNYSKVNSGIYFEVIFNDGYELDEINYDYLKCLYSDEYEHKLLYMLMGDFSVSVTSKIIE